MSLVKPQIGLLDSIYRSVGGSILAALLLITRPIWAQAPAATKTASTGKSKPAPRTTDGHPDFSGFWKNMPGTTPGGNIGKDLPGFKLPLTPAGEAALQHNLTKTIDPESLCILGGIPRHNASGLGFEILQGSKKLAFLYWVHVLPAGPGRCHTEAQRRSRSDLLR